MIEYRWSRNMQGLSIDLVLLSFLNISNKWKTYTAYIFLPVAHFSWVFYSSMNNILLYFKLLSYKVHNLGFHILKNIIRKLVVWISCPPLMRYQSSSSVFANLMVCRDKLGVISLYSSNQALSWCQCPSPFSSEGVWPNKIMIVFSYL